MADTLSAGMNWMKSVRDRSTFSDLVRRRYRWVGSLAGPGGVQQEFSSAVEFHFELSSRPPRTWESIAQDIPIEADEVSLGQLGARGRYGGSHTCWT